MRDDNLSVQDNNKDLCPVIGRHCSIVPCSEQILTGQISVVSQPASRAVSPARSQE